MRVLSAVVSMLIAACSTGDFDASARAESEVFSVNSPSELPFSFELGGEKISGIPAKWSPKKETVSDADKIVETWTGVDSATGLKTIFEKTSYKDFPVVEWIVRLENTGNTDTPEIGNFDAAKIALNVGVGKTVLWHGIGEWTSLAEKNYSFVREFLAENKKFVFDKCVMGYPSNKTFPYFRLIGEKRGFAVAIGWSGSWSADLQKRGEFADFRASQANLRGVIHPREKIRSPRITVLAFANESDGINIWRGWFRKFVMPRERDGSFLRGRIGITARESAPEWVNETEAGQLKSLVLMKKIGVKADTWWIDAGWYMKAGTPSWCYVSQWWKPDVQKYPHGLKYLSDELKKENIELLLWHEPERMFIGGGFPFPDGLKKEWIITSQRKDIVKLEDFAYFDITNPDALDWLCKYMDSCIKANGVSVYREDSNGDLTRIFANPKLCGGRVGFVENFYVQAREKFWKYLRENNRGLWIDSCASGGRRNDLDSLRIGAVPLHYTDKIDATPWDKQRFHNMLSQWFVYYKEENCACVMNKNGKYCDSLTSVGLVAPYSTIWINDFATRDINAEFPHYKMMYNIKKYLPSGDFFVLGDEFVKESSWSASQYSKRDGSAGVVVVARNPNALMDSFVAHVKNVDETSQYRLKKHIGGGEKTVSGNELQKLSITLEKGSGEVFEYVKIR